MSYNSNENNSVQMLCITLAFVVVIVALIIAVTVGSTTNTKVNALLIQQAIEQKADLGAVRCLLHSTNPGCDTVSLVKELRVDPRFAPRSVPSVGEEYQP